MNQFLQSYWYYLIQYKRWFVLGALISLIVSSILYFVLPKKYKSSIVITSASSQSLSKSLSLNYDAKLDLLQYGERDNFNQLIEIVTSQKTMKKCILIFDLFNHYEVDKKSPNAYDEVSAIFNNNFKVSKTDYGSLRISICDKDKLMAYKITSNFTKILDSVNAEIKVDRLKIAIQSLEQNIQNYDIQIKRLQDSLSSLSLAGSRYINLQVDRLSEAYGKAIVSDKNATAELIQSKINKLTSQAATFEKYYNEIGYFQQEKTRLAIKYQDLKMDMQAVIPISYTISNANLPLSNYFPNFIVLFSISLFLIIGSLLIFILLKHQSQLKSI